MAWESIDLLPKTIVGIRQEARSTVYRAALSTNFYCSAGFFLGCTEPWTSPALHFALIAATPVTIDEVWLVPKRLPSLLPAATQLAQHTGTSIVGLFFASDICADDHRHQLEGLWVDATREMKLPYIMFYYTFGHEVFGGSCYFANRFPHDGLRCHSLRGKLSLEPRHNPRRIRAMWRKLLHEMGLA
jgi:hypothetical protein